MIPLNQNLSTLKRSAIRVYSNLARETEDCAMLTIGEPDFDTPEAIKLAAMAALQDNQRAVVVGVTTLGKGSVQVVRELSFGGAVRYTAAYYLTPLGHDINGVGVVPDVTVSDADAQQRIAIETARSFV